MNDRVEIASLHDSRVQLRPSTPVDGPGIVALLRDELAWDANGPMAEPRQLHWRYWQEWPNWQGSRSFVLTQRGEILAHAAVVPGTCASQARRLRTVHMIDWAARPGSIGAGIMLMKHIGRLTDALLAVGGSEQTLAILAALGFRPYRPATPFVRPLRPLRYLMRTAEPSRRRVSRFASSVCRAMGPTSLDGCRFEVRQIAPHEVGATPLPLPRPRCDMAVLERGAAQMGYALACPMAPTALYAIERAGRAHGYFILTSAPGQARLVDCWVDSDDPSDWRSLIRLAVREARKDRGVAEVVALASDSMLSQCLIDCGFHARAARAIHLLATNGWSVPETTLRIQMLDNDSAFNHSGWSEFWA